MTPALIDTHIHLDDDRFDADRDKVVAEAVNAGVCGMIVPATTQSRWSKIQAIAARYANVYPAYGLHPMFTEQHEEDHLEQLQTNLRYGVAIGECGLDKQKHTTDLLKQQYFFETQIAIASEYSMPLIIHARNTIEDVIGLLKKAPLDRAQGNGVVHSFNGSLQQAHRLIDLNFKLSFGGPVTRTNARRLHELVAKLPLEAMMLETDAPDQPGMLHHGTRNEPRWIGEIPVSIAALRSATVEEIVLISNRNAKTLFKLPVDLPEAT